MIVLEKPEALLMSGLRLGPPKKPHMNEVVLPKPLAVIPHQGNRMLTRARTPAITPRKFTLGSFVGKECLRPGRATTIVWILSVFDRDMRAEPLELSRRTLSAFCNPSSTIRNDQL